MAKRRAVNASTDRRVFSATAAKTKKVNLPGTVYRGGLRM